MTDIPPRQVDETLTRALVVLLDSGSPADDVERALDEAVDELDAVGIDSSAVASHLNKHRQVAGESGFPPQSRGDCLDTLRRAHRRLHDRFEMVDELRCLSCDATIRDTEQLLCAECRDSGSDGRPDGDGGGLDIEFNKTSVEISDSDGPIIIGGENNESHTHNH